MLRSEVMDPSGSVQVAVHDPVDMAQILLELVAEVLGQHCLSSALSGLAVSAQREFRDVRGRFRWS